jgi:hypothetical protein
MEEISKRKTYKMTLIFSIVIALVALMGSFIVNFVLAQYTKKKYQNKGYLTKDNLNSWMNIPGETKNNIIHSFKAFSLELEDFEKTNDFSIKRAILKMHYKRLDNKIPFGKLMTNSIVNTTNTLLLILGVITTFSIIITIINNNIYIEPLSQGILSGLLEISQGLKFISMIDISMNLKIVLFTMLISFGGLSVHTQMIGILSDTKIKYTPFFIARISHSFVSGILAFLISNMLIQ